jgi:chorismate mutase
MRSLDFSPRPGQRPDMSVAELQRAITALSPGKRRSVAKFVAHLKRQESPAHKRRLARIAREMEAGNKSTPDQVAAAAMRSVFGCARKFQPAKSSRQILAGLRGYDRDEL